jgi:hypothetical protein
MFDMHRQVNLRFAGFGLEGKDGSSSGYSSPSVENSGVRGLATAAVPLPSRRDQQRTDQRPDDAAGTELEAVSRQQADQQPADEGTDETGYQRQRPVDALGRLAQDQLRAGTNEHAEQNEPEDKHERSIDERHRQYTGSAWIARLTKSGTGAAGQLPGST